LAGSADQGKRGDNFIVAGGNTLTQGLTPRRLLKIALTENKRRINSYDPRLLLRSALTTPPNNAISRQAGLETVARKIIHNTL
jgi:hypothetical protein